MYCDLNNGLKVCYSGHGLNNGIVKVCNLNGSVNRMSGIRIPTVVWSIDEVAQLNTKHLRPQTWFFQSGIQIAIQIPDNLWTGHVRVWMNEWMNEWMKRLFLFSRTIMIEKTLEWYNNG